MPLTIPPEPKEFRPDRPPPGYRNLLVSFNHERRVITPRLQLAHTNGAKGPGSIEASKAWAERRTVGGKATTLPHFQVDLDGDAAMLLELNRQPIANARANPFSIAYETADTGTGTDPTISAFTEPQVQMIANGFAYCHMLHKIALEYPATWDGNGSASHTDPFGYPYWTSYDGKICPGTKKKGQVRDVIIPHARRIVAAWTDTEPPNGDDMALTDAEIDKIAKRAAELVWTTKINVADGTPESENIASVIGWTYGLAKQAAEK